MPKLKSWLYEEPPLGTGFWCSLARSLFGGLLLFKLSEGPSLALSVNNTSSIFTLALSYVFALCMVVGFLSRPAVWLSSFLCLASFHIQQFQLPNYFHLPLVGPGTYGFPTNLYFIGIILLFLGFTPCHDAFSLFGRKNLATRETRLWAVQLIRYQICAMYLWSAIGKILSSVFTSGNTLELAWIYSVAGSLGYYHQADYMRIWALMAHGVIVTELTLAVLLFFPRTRRAGLLIGIMFHFAASLLFPVKNFTAAVAIAYLMFLPPPKRHIG